MFEPEGRYVEVVRISGMSFEAANGGEPLIVVALVRDAPSQATLACALAFAVAIDGKIMLASVVADSSERGRAVRQAAVALAPVDPAYIADPVVLRDRSPTRAVRALAFAQHAAIVVTGRARHAIGGLPCPLVVAPPKLQPEMRGRLARIGVAFDGWSQSRVALDAALGLARRAGAELLLVTVADPHAASSAVRPRDAREALEDHRHAAERYLARELAQLPPGVPTQGRVVLGQPATALATTAEEEELDLLVAGSRGHGAIERVFVGSVSRVLTRRCPCPVMVVPAKESP